VRSGGGGTGVTGLAARLSSDNDDAEEEHLRKKSICSVYRTVLPDLVRMARTR
jgi:hypothetical protein